MATENFETEGFANENLDGVELSDEQIKEVWGGYLPDDWKAKIREICSHFKANGNDLYHCQMFYRRLRYPGAPFTTQEMWDYMAEVWPTL